MDRVVFYVIETKGVVGRKGLAELISLDSEFASRSSSCFNIQRVSLTSVLQLQLADTKLRLYFSRYRLYIQVRFKKILYLFKPCTLLIKRGKAIEEGSFMFAISPSNRMYCFNFTIIFFFFLTISFQLEALPFLAGLSSACKHPQQDTICILFDLYP